MDAVRKHLHWLPVEAIIEFTMLVLAHNGYHGIGPKYLTELIIKTKMSYNFQSIDEFLLNIPQTNKNISLKRNLSRFIGFKKGWTNK